jgi:predicted Fe-S protein YdhL (DUF1289 family)
MEDASPCTGLCRLDSLGVCEGCGRTGEEIGAWPTADRALREAIRRRAAARRAARGPAPPG